MDSLPPRPLGVDESALALEGMYMANPGEFEPVKLPFDDSNARITELAGHKKRVSSVTWSPGGLKLASAGVEQQVRLHDVEHGAGAGKSTALSGHASSVEQLRFDPSRQGGDRLVSVSFDKMVKIWDVRSGKCSTTIDMKTALMNAAWSPSGAHIAVGNKDDVISIIDTKTMKVVWEQKFNFEVNQMVWAPNGKDFLVAARKGEDGTMEKLTFDETTGSLTSQSSNFGHHGGCYCIDVDPKGDFVATGAADAIVAMWDSKTNFCFDTVVRLDCPIRSVSFSHDSKYLASASEDLFMDVADVRTADCMARIKNKEPMNTVEFHPKELVMAYAGDSGMIRLWTAFTGVTMGSKNTAQ